MQQQVGAGVLQILKYNNTLRMPYAGAGGAVLVNVWLARCSAALSAKLRRARPLGTPNGVTSSGGLTTASLKKGSRVKALSSPPGKRRFFLYLVDL